MTIKLGLPKGRMQENVFSLLEEAGINILTSTRTYRPLVSLEGFEAKILKPQNIVEMLHFGSRDLGFAGADWAAELEASVVELLDTKLDPVRIVAAAPTQLLVGGELPKQRIVIASEYDRLATRWMAEKGIDGQLVHSYGATEVFPPEDADCIVDNTATGSTLYANNLQIVDELMRSSTRLYANPRALDDQNKRNRIEDVVMLLKSVLEARQRVMLEVNVPVEFFDSVVGILPCMRKPTVAELSGGAGFAVKVAVPRAEVAELIPRIKAAGGSDIVVSTLSQIIP